MLAAVIAVIYLIKYVKSQIRKARKFVDHISAVTEENMRTPLTLSNNESLMLMRIKKDFPEFNADIAKQTVMAAVADYFALLNNGTGIERLRPVCTAAFVNELEGVMINGTQKFNELKCHKTVISDYRKNGEEAVITYQTALEYALENKALSQHIYETKYVYYLSLDNEGENSSLVCKNCGAPIGTLEEKVCEYCGAQINASIERTWKVNTIHKTR